MKRFAPALTAAFIAVVTTAANADTYSPQVETVIWSDNAIRFNQVIRLTGLGPTADMLEENGVSGDGAVFCAVKQVAGYKKEARFAYFDEKFWQLNGTSQGITEIIAIDGKSFTIHPIASDHPYIDATAVQCGGVVASGILDMSRNLHRMLKFIENS